MIVLKVLCSLILREVGALSRCVQSISDIRFKEINLQKGQFIFLTRICENPGINQMELSEMLKVDKTTTAKAVSKFIEEGLVTRERNEVDRRNYRLYPSQTAKDIYPGIIGEENRNIETCLKGFSEGERELVYRLVKGMRENIESEWLEIKKYNGGQKND